eukprot:5556921-Pyramimonas_sp.AAC.1
MLPPITHREFASAAHALATELDCLRADLVTIRRPSACGTVQDMQRIHDQVVLHRPSPAPPPNMEVDQEGSASHPARD